MKVDVIVAGQSAKLVVEESRFVFKPEGGLAIEREFSIAETGSGTFSILIEGRAYEAFLGGNGEVRINGRSVAVEIFDPRELNSHRRGKTNEGPQTVAAPMPGKVIRVLVAIGDAVEAGQGLIVVEAMKMQNEMKSPKAGRVIEMRARADAAVAAGEVLVVIE